ncbi:MAG: hypothetical protein JWP38_895 [Herbaspirillum sp.]|nr:hypothetical protein [Herbaspirillum sp.]
MVLLGSAVAALADTGQKHNESDGGAMRAQIERSSFDGRGEAKQNAVHAQQDDHRTGGRLSPDERRELRRQINEVGQDIYRPHR